MYEVHVREFMNLFKEDVRVLVNNELILSILVYTFFSRMFDLMLHPVVKHSIVGA